MMRFAAKLPGAARVTRSFSLLKPLLPPALLPLPFRFFSAKNSTDSIVSSNPIALQTINFALILARFQKSDESYARKACWSWNSASPLNQTTIQKGWFYWRCLPYYLRGNFAEAIEKLQFIQDLSLSSVVVRVAATEALVGLDLELDQDDSASVLAEICLQLLETIKLELGGGNAIDVLEARAKAIKGLVKLVQGDFESGVQDDGFCTACTMTKDEVLLAATCGLGHLEAHLGHYRDWLNFTDAEDILTGALKRAEEHFGSRHPKVSAILTCVALMYHLKSTMEHSSSLLIQEGLYGRAIELLKALALETKGKEAKILRSDIAALARGGYAETLCLQHNRKSEGERMKHWAQAVWKNRKFSLAGALELSESSSKVPIIDARICIALQFTIFHLSLL